MTKPCPICKAQSANIFQADVLKKHRVHYYCCNHCQFVFTEKPYWLEEAYKKSINATDTGILQRNYWLSKLSSVILYFLFDRQGKYLDYAGGYGLFTRLMRDIGFDFYWQDKYTENLFSPAFTYSKKSGPPVLLTSFESFEHFPKPVVEIKKMLTYSKNILFTTEMLPSPVPAPQDWWYYGLEHGQHLSFYSEKTMKFLADHFGLFYVGDGCNIHLFTEKKISEKRFKRLIKMTKLGGALYVRKKMHSRTIDDMYLLREKK